MKYPPLLYPGNELIGILYFCTMTKKDLVTLLAFFLFLTGFTSLTLSLVGIRWKFLSWINEYSVLAGFLSQIGMILLAIIMLVVVNTSKEEKSD